METEGDTDKVRGKNKKKGKPKQNFLNQRQGSAAGEETERPPSWLWGSIFGSEVFPMVATSLKLVAFVFADFFFKKLVLGLNVCISVGLSFLHLIISFSF